MRVIDFLEMYDDWNTNLKVNDDELNTIYHDNTYFFVDNYKMLHNYIVVSFGIINGDLTIRIKEGE